MKAPHPGWQEWERAFNELTACNIEFKKARDGGNPISVARAWSTVTAAEARLNEVAGKLDAEVDLWLESAGHAYSKVHR